VIIAEQHKTVGHIFCFTWVAIFMLQGLKHHSSVRAIKHAAMHMQVSDWVATASALTHTIILPLITEQANTQLQTEGVLCMGILSFKWVWLK
jgi:hypothetical protein